MAKRVGVILSGCGGRDGSDAAEALLALLILDRAHAEAVCVAPEAARAEAARLLPGAAGDADVGPLAALDPRDIDALIIPGGGGVATLLSDYGAKGQLCQVDPDVARVLRALLPARRPMAFMGLAAVLAARVLGPVAGVRVTLGSKATPAGKHAAVMGADVRPATAEDVIVDEKNRIFSTPGFATEGARLAAVARAADKLVRGLLTITRDRAPAPAQVAPLGASPNPPAAGARDQGSRPGSGEQGQGSRPGSGEQGSRPIVRKATGRARGSA
jgi:enhancing lycopene biosynthesis protein 2